MQAKQIDSKGNCSVCGGTHYGSLECPTLAGLRQRCISKFCEEEIPIFHQGEPEHELEDFVTAADCTYWVAEIKRLNRFADFLCRQDWTSRGRAIAEEAFMNAIAMDKEAGFPQP